MHVREIPRQIFKELVKKPEEVIPVELGKQLYPNTYSDSGYSHQPTLVGEDSAWLRLDDNPDKSFTSLSVHESFESAALDSSYNGIGRIIACRRETGTWAAIGGSELRQDVWIQLGRDTLKLGRNLELSQLGKIARLAVIKVKSGLFDVSTHWEEDIDVSNIG